jgi:hypothetical protein
LCILQENDLPLVIAKTSGSDVEFIMRKKKALIKEKESMLKEAEKGKVGFVLRAPRFI